MTTYAGCDCDRYNPNCRCYPRETTMSEQTTPGADEALEAAVADEIRKSVDMMSSTAANILDERDDGFLWPARAAIAAVRAHNALPAPPSLEGEG